jgi:hypothetical protein
MVARPQDPLDPDRMAFAQASRRGSAEQKSQSQSLQAEQLARRSSASWLASGPPP